MKMEDDLIVAVLSEHAQARFKERMLAEAEEGIEMIQGVMTDEVQSAIIDNVRIGIPFVLNYEGLILVLHWADCLTKSAVELCKSADLNAEIAIMSEYEDADEYLKSNPAELFSYEILNRTLNASEFQLHYNNRTFGKHPKELFRRI